jgi:hypothetical protein
VERCVRLRAVERRLLLYPIEEASLRLCQHPIENWRVDFYSDLMTEALTESLEAKVAEVAAIDDHVRRGLAAREARDLLAARDRELLEILRTAVQTLRREGRTWAEVGGLFGRSHAWAEALATGRSSKRGKAGHAAESTPRAGAAEGHSPDTSTTDQ